MCGERHGGSEFFPGGADSFSEGCKTIFDRVFSSENVSIPLNFLFHKYSFTCIQHQTESTHMSAFATDTANRINSHENYKDHSRRNTSR